MRRDAALCYAQFMAWSLVMAMALAASASGAGVSAGGPNALVLALRKEQAGDEAGAAAALRDLVKRFPSQALPRIEEAKLALKRSDDSLAKRDLTRALVLAPRNPRVHYLWGLYWARNGQPDVAIEELRAAVALRDGYAKARERLAALCTAAGDLTDAEAQLRWIAAHEPNRQISRFRLARVLEREGKPEAAASVLKALVAEHPDSEVALRALADFYRRRGKPRRAAHWRAKIPAPQHRKMRPLPRSRR